MDRRCVASQRGGRGFSSPTPTSRPRVWTAPLLILHHFRAPAPSPGPGTRARPGPVLHSQGVGTVNCPQPRRAVPPPPGALRSTRPARPPRSPHSSSGRARQSPRAHGAASGAGRGRARRALSSSPRQGSRRPGSLPGSGQPPPLGDPAGTWVGVRRLGVTGRRAAQPGRRGLGF